MNRYSKNCSGEKERFSAANKIQYRQNIQTQDKKLINIYDRPKENQTQHYQKRQDVSDVYSRNHQVYQEQNSKRMDYVSPQKNRTQTSMDKYQTPQKIYNGTSLSEQQNKQNDSGEQKLFTRDTSYKSKYLLYTAERVKKQISQFDESRSDIYKNQKDSYIQSNIGKLKYENQRLIDSPTKENDIIPQEMNQKYLKNNQKYSEINSKQAQRYFQDSQVLESSKQEDSIVDNVNNKRIHSNNTYSVQYQNSTLPNQMISQANNTLRATQSDKQQQLNL